MVAASAAAKLRTKVGALNLIELLDLAPGSIANRSRNVDLEFQDRHRDPFTTESQRHREKKKLKLPPTVDLVFLAVSVPSW